MTGIPELVQSVKSGAIPRETYWTEMFEHHKLLREYHPLLATGNVDRIEIDSRELRIVMKNGCVFAWLPEDFRIATSLAVNYGSYESSETAFLIKASRLKATTLDIGANIGWHVVHMAKIGGSRPRSLHAFEPVPGTFSALSRNVALNGLEDAVVLNNCGLSDTKSTMTMFVPRFNGSGAASLARLHPTDESAEVTVDLNTLDAYCAENAVTDVGLVKVDVEGAELMVLRGAMSMLERERPVLFLELLRKWSKAFGYHPNDVIALLAGIGYSCWCIDGDRLRPVPEVTDETVETNFVFLQPGIHDVVLGA